MPQVFSSTAPAKTNCLDMVPSAKTDKAFLSGLTFGLTSVSEFVKAKPDKGAMLCCLMENYMRKGPQTTKYACCTMHFCFDTSLF